MTDFCYGTETEETKINSAFKAVLLMEIYRKLLKHKYLVDPEYLLDLQENSEDHKQVINGYRAWLNIKSNYGEENVSLPRLFGDDLKFTTKTRNTRIKIDIKTAEIDFYRRHGADPLEDSSERDAVFRFLDKNSRTVNSAFLAIPYLISTYGKDILNILEIDFKMPKLTTADLSDYQLSLLMFSYALYPEGHVIKLPHTQTEFIRNTWECYPETLFKTVSWAVNKYNRDPDAFFVVESDLDEGGFIVFENNGEDFIRKSHPIHVNNNAPYYILDGLAECIPPKQKYKLGKYERLTQAIMFYRETTESVA